MSKLNITKEDVAELDQFIAEFSKNIIKNYTASNAVEAWSKKLSLKDKFTIVGKKMRMGVREKFAVAYSPEKEARALVKYCQTILPTMQRAFGDELLLRSLPTKPGQEQRIAELCKAFGAQDLVDLYAKSQQFKAQSANVKKPAGPDQPKQ